MRRTYLQVIRMRRLLALSGLLCIVSLLAFAWLRQENLQDAQKEFYLTLLLGEREGYILTPPEFVAQPFIRRLDWSPDGKYAVLVQTVVRMDNAAQANSLRHRVLAWSRKSRRVSVLWESERTSADIDARRDVQIAFFKNASACVFAIREGKFASKLSETGWSVHHATLDGRAIKLGQFEKVYLLTPPEDEMRYLVWYRLNLATERFECVYAPVSVAGRIGEVRLLPPAITDIALSAFATESDVTSWHADGKQVIAPLMLAPSEETGEPSTPVVEIRYILWDPRTNQERAITRAELSYYEPEVLQSLRVEHEIQRAQHKRGQAAVHTSWLTEGEQATLLAADSSLAAVAPQGDGILYVAHGTAFFRQLMKAPAEQLRQTAVEARVNQYLAHGKQIAYAIMMYAADYEETFPINLGDEGVATVLMPYLRQPAVFEVDGAFAFRYLLNGQNLADIQNPATVEIGYLELPEGRVVIYADGQVKWRPNQ
ncbi:MAG: hypothetical protein NZ874_10055 [Fimbriimonadales bacterium]|nr:hypothetical protein [Fimbriimonadales bacterium]